MASQLYEWPPEGEGDQSVGMPYRLTIRSNSSGGGSKKFPALEIHSPNGGGLEVSILIPFRNGSSAADDT